MNKNEKKLFIEDKYVTLTEKEIKLLELLMNSKPVTKDYILEQVWNYSSEADTHTVETHIYRLRKKINEKFGDDNFISINKRLFSLKKRNKIAIDLFTAKYRKRIVKPKRKGSFKRKI